MKVLHLIARMNVGGTARYLTMLDAGLNQSGIESAIATGFVQGAEAEDPSIASVKLHRINHLGRAINPIADHKAFKEFEALVAKEKPDIIHSHTFKAGLIARARRNSFEKAAGKKIKFVHTFHGHLLDDPEFIGPKKSAIIAIEKALATKTDKLITVGQKVANELLDNNIGQPNQFINIPPGVNPLPTKSKEAARQELGITHSPVIGWLARVTGVKNPLLAAEVAKEIPNATFIFGGDGDLLPELKKSAPINSKIYGWVDAATFLSACDIIISTSENEGMPVALIEAQLAGLPVVATNVGSTSEVVINNKTGIVTHKKKSELVAAINRLLASPETLKNMGNSAQSHARTTFSPESMINKHIDLYRLLS
jgi:glycosyltransferase involved in cell wall biosynthesis